MRRTVTRVLCGYWLLAACSLLANSQVSGVAIVADRSSFSNLQWIPLRVLVKGKDAQSIKVNIDNPPAPAGLFSRQADSGTKPQTNSGHSAVQQDVASAGTVKVLLQATELNGNKTVPIIVREWGSGREGIERYIAIYIQIPVDDQIRDDAVEKYFQYQKNKTEANRAKEPGPAKLYSSKGGHDLLTAQMRGQYMQGRIGKFTIGGDARYEEKGRGARTFKISPTTIEITFKGNFFDQPTFRR